MDLSRFFSHAQIGRNEEFDAIPAQLLRKVYVEILLLNAS